MNATTKNRHCYFRYCSQNENETGSCSCSGFFDHAADHGQAKDSYWENDYVPTNSRRS